MYYQSVSLPLTRRFVHKLVTINCYTKSYNINITIHYSVTCLQNNHVVYRVFLYLDRVKPGSRERRTRPGSVTKSNRTKPTRFEFVHYSTGDSHDGGRSFPHMILE